MYKQFFKINAITVSMALCFNAWADAQFTGDVNQTSSTQPAPTYTGDIIVGNTDTSGSAASPAGTLVVDGGTQVTGNRSLLIGNGVDSSGSVTVTGDSSGLSLGRYTIVGNGSGAYGELIIKNGAIVNAVSSGTPATVIGNASGSTGLVSVSGEGSAFRNTGSVRIGETGNGTLNISDNATATAWAITLGQNAGSRGVVNVEGGTLLLQGNASPGYEYVLIGAKGEGVMNVTQGGYVSDRYTLVGGAGGRGTLTVSGNRSIFNSALSTTVGTDNGGTGVVIVSDGGTLNASVSGTPTNGESLVLGNVAGATGDVIVSGENATVNATGGSTVIGKGGTSSLTLQNGGTLNAADVTIAAAEGSTGVLNIGAAAGSPATEAGALNNNAGINFGDGDGTLNFNHTGDVNFANLIQGNGNVDVNSGETTLTAANTWSGTTTINAGTLRAGSENTFSPNAIYAVAADGTLDTNGFSQTIGSVTNAGTINLVPGAPGTLLTVNGNYAGNGGLLVFGTALADDSSATDRLIVTGDTSGTSRVAVNNLGGSGAQTLNGIELISVGGASDGEFTQQGRIVAGAWEYHLARGEGANVANWYLSSRADNNGGGDNPGNGGGDNPGNGGGDNPGNGGGDNPGNGGGNNPGNGGGNNPGNGGGDTPGNTGGDIPGGGVQELRPEGGAYTANLYAADMMFSAPLSDRMGETEYTDTMTGERHLTSLWLKNTGGHTRFSDSTGQLKTRANRYSLLLGGDLATGNAANGSTWRTGALAGYGNSQSRTVSSLSGYGAKGDVNGYTAGLYGTWYGDGSSERGMYVDGVVQYSWFRNTVQGDELAGEKYDSKGLSATLETGYVFAMGNVAGRQDLNWYLQPKASATWSGIGADDHREVNGTRVTSDGDNNVSTRFGLKTFLKGHSALDDGKSRNFKPFVEASWIHNTQSRGATLDGVEVSQAGTRNIGELRTGVEGRIAPQWNVTGYVAQQMGDKGYSDTAAVLGVKYSF